MEENILLRVGIDQNTISQSEKAIVSARVEIDRLKESNKQLEQQGQKNSVQYVKNQTDIKDLSNTVRENERVLQANAKMSRSTSGSIAELRESVKTLQAEYVNLSAEERENEKVGGELQKRIKAQNDALKDLEKQIGITGRNVGNYKEEINAALKESGLFNQAQAAMAAAQQAVSAASKVAAISTRSFGAALVATGIGAILVLFGSLVAFLTRTQEGMDFVSKATSGLTTFISVLFDALANLGKQITENIIPTFIGLKDILVGIATLDFNQVSKGIDGVKTAASNVDSINLLTLGANAAKAAKEAFQLEENLIALQREEAEFGVQIAKNEARINKLREAAKDETKTFAERTAALQEAVKIEEEQLDQSLMFAKQRLAILTAQNNLTTSTQADLQKQIDLQIQIEKLEAAASNNRIKINKELKAINGQREAEAKRLREERAREEERIANDILAVQKKADAEAVAEQNKVNKEFQASVKEKEQIVQQTIKDQINLLKNQFVEGEILQEEYQDRLSQIEATAIEIRKIALQEQLEETRLNLQIDADTRLAIEADLQQKLRSLEDQTLDAKVKNAQVELQAAKKLKEENEALAKLGADAEIQAREAVLSAAIDIFGRESAAGKIAASFQAAISTFAAANNALENIPSPFNFIVAAATTAQGLANVARINSKPAPKFQEGGAVQISGPSHAGGGVDVALGGQTVANVEGGEGLFVMKKDAFQSLKSLSNYNQMFGGNSWFGGGKKFLADGGAITRGSTPQLDRRSLQEAQTSIGNAMQQINVITRVTDINRVSDEMKIVEMQGDLR